MGNKHGVSTTKSFRKQYKLKRVLGTGNFSTVHLAKRRSDKRYFAVKIVSRAHLNEKELRMLGSELEVLKTLNHPNVVRVYEVLEDKRNVYIVMEALLGGDLIDVLVSRNRPLSERRAARVARDVARALAYCHNIGLAHRDVKPGNVIFSSTDPESPASLCDFGFAKYLSADAILKTRCGSPHFVAPEVLDGKPYTTAVDMWGLGAIVYVALCAERPFKANSQAKLFDAIKAASFSFGQEKWGKISDGAKDLVSSLFQVYPENRPSAAEVLHHPWICSFFPEDPPLPLSERRRRARRKFRLLGLIGLAVCRLERAGGVTATSARAPSGAGKQKESPSWTQGSTHPTELVVVSEPAATELIAHGRRRRGAVWYAQSPTARSNEQRRRMRMPSLDNDPTGGDLPLGDSSPVPIWSPLTSPSLTTGGLLRRSTSLRTVPGRFAARGPRSSTTSPLGAQWPRARSSVLGSRRLPASRSMEVLPMGSELEVRDADKPPRANKITWADMKMAGKSKPPTLSVDVSASTSTLPPLHGQSMQRGSPLHKLLIRQLRLPDEPK